MILQTVLLFGPPGAGKGTQAKRLEKAMTSPHVSTGDMFRDHLGRRSELGHKVEKIMGAGQLVPDSLTNDLVRDRLLKPDVALGVILDGYPRNVAQAKWLELYLSGRGLGIRGVVAINVPPQELAARLKGRALKEGRADDADEAVIARRIGDYVAQTEACLDYYRKRGVAVHSISGLGSVEEVEARIHAALGLRA